MKSSYVRSNGLIRFKPTLVGASNAELEGPETDGQEDVKPAPEGLVLRRGEEEEMSVDCNGSELALWREREEKEALTGQENVARVGDGDRHDSGSL